MAGPDAGWLQTVRRVIEAVSASDVAEFELLQQRFRLRLKRVGSPRGRPATAAQPGEASAPAGLQVVAPFTGIFYRSSSPTTEPYVHEGDWVEGGQTVGLIETMKIFNEVTADQAGRIERILVQNGQLVHAGDALMMLVPGERPAEPELRV